MSADPFDLERFLNAQEAVYEQVVSELKAEQKRTHWMWFIFPQFEGLAHSSTSQYFAIKSQEEAKAYLQHSVLGKRLEECTQLVLAVKGRFAVEIFGSPDDIKLKSSMTLFAEITEDHSIFYQVLKQYYQGTKDEKTVSLLKTAH